jgi:hypothetical protein
VQRNQLKTLLGRLDRPNDLKNQIAHCEWGAGNRSGSIAPSRKPAVFNKIRVSSPAEGAKDYTAAEIAQKADLVVAIVTTYGSDGRTWQHFGNQTYGSDGTTWGHYGNQSDGSNSVPVQRFGNQFFGSNGTTCQQTGQQPFCN